MDGLIDITDDAQNYGFNSIDVVSKNSDLIYVLVPLGTLDGVKGRSLKGHEFSTGTSPIVTEYNNQYIGDLFNKNNEPRQQLRFYKAAPAAAASSGEPLAEGGGQENLPKNRTSARSLVATENNQKLHKCSTQYLCNLFAMPSDFLIRAFCLRDSKGISPENPRIPPSPSPEYFAIGQGTRVILKNGFYIPIVAVVLYSQMTHASSPLAPTSALRNSAVLLRS